MQRLPNFLPLGVDQDPLSLQQERCEGQRGALGVRCERIKCTVRNLEAGRPPSQVTIFAYLFVSSLSFSLLFLLYLSLLSSLSLSPFSSFYRCSWLFCRAFAFLHRSWHVYSLSSLSSSFQFFVFFQWPLSCSHVKARFERCLNAYTYVSIIYRAHPS